MGEDYERIYEAREIFYYKLVVQDGVSQEKFRSMFQVFEGLTGRMFRAITEYVGLAVDYERMGEEKESVLRRGHPEERVKSVKEGDEHQA